MRPRCGPRILIFHFWHLLTLRKCLRASVISSSCVLSVCARVCVPVWLCVYNRFAFESGPKLVQPLSPSHCVSRCLYLSLSLSLYLSFSSIFIFIALSCLLPSPLCIISSLASRLKTFCIYFEKSKNQKTVKNSRKNQNK